MPAGRPSEFTQEMADFLCEQLIEGRSLRAICMEENTPSASTVCRWLSANEEFRKQYAHAREAQADTLFDESLSIADDDEGDLVEEKDGDKVIYRGNSVRVARDKLRVDTRRWMASKLAPKRYGEKIETEHTGGTSLTIVTGVPRGDD